MRFRLPNIDNFSFWLGIILSSLFWWGVSVLRPAFQELRANARTRQAEKKEKAHAFNAIEEHYRAMVLLHAQGLHLAAPLFSLDEILEPPRLLAPPARVEPGVPLYNDDTVESTIPYLPAWPELASIYQTPTLTLSEALSGNSDIVLIGQTGMGKTVALANLASCLARRELQAGLSPETLPCLIHVADLDLPVNKDNPLKGIIDFIAEKSPVFDLPRIPDFIRRMFTEGRILLLLDGTDELTPDGLKNAVEFIRAIKRTYPKTRMITTASIEYLDGLVSLNFIPFALSSWDSGQNARFLERWGDLWEHHVAVESWAQTSDQVDALLLNGWLRTDANPSTPLELTLKAWAAFAGDLRGSSLIDALDAHVRRLTPANTPREALESLALQVNLAAEPIFDPRKAHQWVKSFEPDEAEPIEEPGQEETEQAKPGKKAQPKSPSLGLISKMAESGLLSQHRNNHMRFSQPILCGFLAGKLLSGYTEAIMEQPPWIGKYLAMHFLAAQGEATSLSNALISLADRPLSRNLLIVARWLRDAPIQASWRGQIFARLADLLQQNGQPLGLRGQALAAFVRSGDPGSSVLLRQLHTVRDAELLQLAALGVGALRDVKSTEILITLLKNPSPNVQRAACLALALIGTTGAMDALASTLLHGDENLRRAAAEAMSLHPTEGHKMLREGAGLKEDLNVRRAVAFGLGRIHQPWADELLNQLQLEDDQWVVRNAALETLEERRRPNKHIPLRIPPPSESPWLIAFAGKQGLGISPDVPPTDLLLRALKSDDLEERLAALPYLRMMPTEGVFGALYQAMYAGEPEIREAVFQTISEMAARGVDVPDPVQFGVGY
jgi:HEAT repeat protein